MELSKALICEIDDAFGDAQRFVVCAVEANVDIPDFDATKHVTWQRIERVREQIRASALTGTRDE